MQVGARAAEQGADRAVEQVEQAEELAVRVALEQVRVKTRQVPPSVQARPVVSAPVNPALRGTSVADLANRLARAPRDNAGVGQAVPALVSEPVRMEPVMRSRVDSAADTAPVAVGSVGKAAASAGKAVAWAGKWAKVGWAPPAKWAAVLVNRARRSSAIRPADRARSAPVIVRVAAQVQANRHTAVHKGRARIRVRTTPDRPDKPRIQVPKEPGNTAPVNLSVRNRAAIG